MPNSQVLCYGDVISLYSEGTSIKGFLSILGMIDDRLVVTPLSGSPQDPPFRYRDCLFKIVPMLRYSAQNQFANSHLNAPATIADAFFHKQLELVASNERKQNLASIEKTRGSEIVYGNIVQLLSVKTNKFVTVSKNMPAAQEKNAMKVYLDNDGNEV